MVSDGGKWLVSALSQGKRVETERALDSTTYTKMFHSSFTCSTTEEKNLIHLNSICAKTMLT